MFSSQNSQVSNDALYIEDVFSTYLFTGTGANLNLINGLKNDYTDVTTSVSLPPTTSTDGTSLTYYTNSIYSNSGDPIISTTSQATNGRSVQLKAFSGYAPASTSANFAYGTGDFCIELWVYRTDSGSCRVFTHSDDSINLDMNSDGSLGTYQFGGLTAPAGSVALNTWTHIALTRSGTTGRLFINGTQASSAGSISTNWGTNRRIHIGINNNFDGDSFTGLIGDVRVYKGSAKYTSGFTPATTLTTDTNVVFLVSYNSSTSFRSGTSTTQSINKHVMSWGKARNNGNYYALSDTLRGGAYALITNTTDAPRYKPITGYIKSLLTNGIVLGSEGDINGNGNSMVNWSFRQAPKFFDVVTWTGDDTERTISHNLGAVPGCIIVKRTDTTSNWTVYHRELNAANAYQYYISLNLTTARTADNIWGAAPTSTVFTVTADAKLNASGGTYVAYLFAHNAGGFGLTGTDNVISCGSYTGNGSTTGPSITLNYEPQWVMIKRTDVAANWILVDTMRGFVNSGTVSDDQLLFPNLSDAEGTGGCGYPTATGFQINTTNAFANASGGTYIYIAIRRGPMKVPTSGTSVFSPNAQTTAAPTTVTTNFPVDLEWWRNSRTTAGRTNYSFDRLRGGTQQLRLNTTDAEQTDTAPYINYFDSNTTFKENFSGSGQDAIFWSFRRAPSFFDEVCYTGDGTSNRAISHNLGVVPELIINRPRNYADYWEVYHKDVGLDSYFYLNSTNAPASSSGNWSTMTSSVFGAGYAYGHNYSGRTYVTYLFATCPGVSKVGSYTGTGTTKQVDCGFTGGARFVLIKRTDSTGDWYVWDSARGIVSGNDPYLLLNSTAAEVTNTDYVDTYSAGFEISSTAPAAINANGGTYIFLAIA